MSVHLEYRFFNTRKMSSIETQRRKSRYNHEATVVTKFDLTCDEEEMNGLFRQKASSLVCIRYLIVQHW